MLSAAEGLDVSPVASEDVAAGVDEVVGVVSASGRFGRTPDSTRSPPQVSFDAES
ncbi:hypothetical protein [Pseudonocardia alaniniphila]|uniref:Uncharacterized protein n=1 Tax=Pseudonocardia alaniniphila TaxID=75291 RepID=A0ABS9TTN8_9PSEU|nr:hypothetical protein [Pseudonocardia alaniniphila]MCH6171910.1 hypothetical protein [Pseudonocardia alaniniphila]